MRFLIFVLLFIITTIICISSLTITAQASGPPQIPHVKSGLELCLNCHNPAGTGQLPPSHNSYSESICHNCHTEAVNLPKQGICLNCHGQPGINMTFNNGEQLSLYVDPNIFVASNHGHGDKLLCTDCHSDSVKYPHDNKDISSKREYSIKQYEVCKNCHADNYNKTLDSVHYQMLSSGNLQAPLCTDCHGAHAIILPSETKTKIAQTCAKCHQDIYSKYANSVHGKGVLEEGNTDVPVCTDCHRSHSIEDPRTASFHFDSVQICSNCHGNETLMQRYNISTNVVRTYLEDFHGKTVALIGKQDKDIWAEQAVCFDCHGIHDIQKVDNPESSVIKANLLVTCQKCHPDATTNFPGAWLSHYEPTINKSPVVFLVKLFYWILIPLIIGGLVIHITLDLWRRYRVRKQINKNGG